MQVRSFAQQTCRDAVATMPPILWTVPIAIGGILFLLVTGVANREMGKAIDDQVAQEEGAFCMQLGQAPGTQYDTCIAGVSKLTERVRAIKSNELM